MIIEERMVSRDLERRRLGEAEWIAIRLDEHRELALRVLDSGMLEIRGTGSEHLVAHFEASNSVQLAVLSPWHDVRSSHSGYRLEVVPSRLCGAEGGEE